MNIGISVIVCCYNSSLRLPETIRHLAQQKVSPDIAWEVVIVNNKSTDDTVIVAEKEWASYNRLDVGFIIVDELVPGLIYAREKGLKIAQYEYIVFCDDDNWLDESYLDKGYNILERDKRIGAVGGRGIAVSEVDFPDWFNKYSGGYAIGNPDTKAQYQEGKNFLYGAGLAFRKSLYDEAYLHYPSFLVGREGEKLTSGEDSEFAIRLKLMGYSLYYERDMTFRHFIPANRLTEEYRDRMFEGFRDASDVLESYIFQMMLPSYSYKLKATLTLKSLLKLIICTIINIKRWNKQIEIDSLYQLTGISFGKVGSISKSIRDFADRYKNRF
jgi:glycosyltransferase involved in cell wall biosynthesis